MKKPPRAFVYSLGEGWTVLAGRTDADNERLTFEVARPADFWFHVRGMPGSHVILKGPEGENPGRALLERAAAIAAYHSKARSAGIVPVSCTRARDVTKPRGAPSGTVAIRKERIFKVRPSRGEPADLGSAGPEEPS